MEVKEKEEQIQKLQTAELEKKSLEESNVILLERHVSLLLLRLVYYPPSHSSNAMRGSKQIA
jgi:hypothetical protein